MRRCIDAAVLVTARAGARGGANGVDQALLVLDSRMGAGQILLAAASAMAHVALSDVADRTLRSGPSGQAGAESRKGYVGKVVVAAAYRAPVWTL